MEILESAGLSAATFRMPNLNGRVIAEPNEFEIQQLIPLARKGQLHSAARKHTDWFCYRLLPSLACFGCYPPPFEASAANEQFIK